MIMEGYNATIKKIPEIKQLLETKITKKNKNS